KSVDFPRHSGVGAKWRDLDSDQTPRKRDVAGPTFGILGIPGFTRIFRTWMRKWQGSRPLRWWQVEGFGQRARACGIHRRNKIYGDWAYSARRRVAHRLRGWPC